MKGIGIILIVLGTSGIGYLTAADLKRHLNDLRWLRRIMLLLKEEITYTHAPLGEAFARISGKVKAPYCLFLTQVSGQLARRAGSSFAEIWCCAVEERLHTTKLTREAGRTKRVWKQYRISRRTCPGRGDRSVSGTVKGRSAGSAGRTGGEAEIMRLPWCDEWDFYYNFIGIAGGVHECSAYF